MAKLFHSEACKKRGFLDLSAEIRLLVYGNFAGVPSSDAGEENDAISKTRWSLLFVSRVVGAEWSETFGSTASFKIAAENLTLSSGHPCRQDSAKFEKRMSMTPTDIMQRIRVVEYILPENDDQKNNKFPDPNHPAIQDLRHLATVLRRNKNKLPSLEEVIISRRTAVNANRVTKLRSDGSWGLKSWTKAPHDWEKIWTNIISEDKTIQQEDRNQIVAKQFEIKNGMFYDRGWTSFRRVRLRNNHIFPQLGAWEAEEIQLVFHKHSSSKPTRRLIGDWIRLPPRFQGDNGGSSACSARELVRSRENWLYDQSKQQDCATTKSMSRPPGSASEIQKSSKLNWFWQNDVENCDLSGKLYQNSSKQED